jgi:hypothetical protein
MGYWPTFIRPKEEDSEQSQTFLLDIDQNDIILNQDTSFRFKIDQNWPAFIRPNEEDTSFY